MLTRDVKRLALRMMRALDTPVSLKVAILIEAEEWDQLVRCTIDPRQYEPMVFNRLDRDRRPAQYCGLKEFRLNYQAVSFLRKFNGDAGIDTEAAAEEAFFAAERQCFTTNLRLRRLYNPDGKHSDLEHRAVQLLAKAKSFVGLALGDFPDPWGLKPRFGPGATFESSGWGRNGPLTVYKKLVNKPAITPAFKASGLFEMFFDKTAFTGSWGDSLTTFVTTSCDKFTTVLKNALTKRGICPNPGANLIAQLAVGDCMKEVLRYLGLELKPKSGVDISGWIAQNIGRLPGHAVKRHPRARSVTNFLRRGNGGQKLHQNLAKIGSVDGESVTIDLKSASDTVCYELVKVLLPCDWFFVLDTLRTPKTLVRDEVHVLEKFSAMGNGFTFELETLVFASLAHACGCKIGVDTFVYGDDLIVPRERAADLIALLQFCGFTPNASKTYLDGYFRESCGGDYLFGQDVRPYFLKEDPIECSDWIAVANSIRRIAINWGLESEFKPVWKYCTDRITSRAKCYGPENLGDLCIHAPEELWSVRIRNSIRYVRVWKPIQEKVFLPSVRRQATTFKWDSTTHVYREVRVNVSDIQARYDCIALSSAMLGFPVEDGLAPRDSVSGHRPGWVAYS